MRVSVIIVSYNVYPFLDNCLRSVRQALQGIDGEIWVVDNASVDRTPQLLHEYFPEVRLIANPDNKGFAKANNQALSLATGEFVLLLNPDTVLSEDTISSCIAFMDQHAEAGAVGVRMLDGSGRYLPESKRGLPTLLASFMKMTGLYRVFPHSRLWNRYYQGHVRENQTAEIEVLTGAFMFVRKKALDKAGWLDEDFFMYGEDIDLSYRLTKAGFRIYYLPVTQIIHYKGESTKKTTLNYLMTFYQAMLIFIRKHPEFKGQQGLIHLAIYLHGGTQLVRQALSRAWPAGMDTLLLFGSFYGISRLWASYYFHDPAYFRSSFYTFNIPLYTAIGILSMYVYGAYDRPMERKRSWIGFFSGMLLLIILYAFLPVYLRTSRMVIGSGAMAFLFFIGLTRAMLPPWKKSVEGTTRQATRKAIIVAGNPESDRIKELINRSRDQIEIIGTVTPDAKTAGSAPDVLGPLSKIDEIIRVHQVREVIFSAQDVPFSAFTAAISKLGPGLRFMLAASTTMNIVGSMNRDTEGESYGLRIHFRLSDAASRRSKRLFDLLLALLCIPLIPLLAILVPGPAVFLKNLWKVLTGQMTWVSYHPGDRSREALPALRAGVLAPAYPSGPEDTAHKLEHIHYVYARDYHWTTDLAIVASQWRRLGQTLTFYGP